MDLKTTYNKIAEDWFKQFKDGLWWTRKIDDFIAFLKPGASILDVGCGPGITAKYLAEKGFDVTGVDFSESMIDIAQREVPNGKFLVMDVKELGQLAETFEGIVAQAILLHFPKKNALEILQIIKNRLKPGGYLYVAVKEIGEDNLEEKMLKTKTNNQENERFMSYYRMVELKKCLADLGMTVVKEEIVPALKGLPDNWLRVIAKN